MGLFFLLIFEMKHAILDLDYYENERSKDK